MQFYEVSAKKGTNVKKAYDFLLESAYAYVLKYKKPSTSSVLSSHSAIVPKKKCC